MDTHGAIGLTEAKKLSFALLGMGWMYPSCDSAVSSPDLKSLHGVSHCCGVKGGDVVKVRAWRYDAIDVGRCLKGKVDF